jgi:hypothetical protein
MRLGVRRWLGVLLCLGGVLAPAGCARPADRPTTSRARSLITPTAFSPAATAGPAASGPASTGGRPPGRPSGGQPRPGSPPPSAPVLGPAIPPSTLADGRAYNAWIVAVTAGPTVRLELARHLTGKDVTGYLAAHDVPPPGQESLASYLEVDLGQSTTVRVAASAAITATSAGMGPRRMTVAQFVAWLPANLARPDVDGGAARARDGQPHPGLPGLSRPRSKATATAAARSLTPSLP